jgi:hypothetical protein
MADPDAGKDADALAAAPETRAADATDAGNDGADEAQADRGNASEDADKAGTTKTFTIDTDTPVIDTAENRAGGTTPSWWEWVRRHRRPVMVVAGLVVVALVATLVLVVFLTPGPKDVVQDYLDAIRAGDTEAALAIAGEPADDERLEFLSAEALADDWTVDAVVERHRSDDETDIDVTISAGGISQQGRFSMVHGDDGWTMESPFVRVDLAAGNLTTVELGSEQRIKENAAAQPTGIVQLLVFPGVYKLYPSLAKQLTFEPSVLIAAPQENEEATVRVTAGYTLTGAGADAAQQALNAHIDGCAKKTDIEPAGCPFNAENSDAVQGLDHFDDIVWTIVTHPEAHFAMGNGGGLTAVVRKPGTVRVTGSAVPEEPEDSPRTTFTLTCEFGLTGMTIDMDMEGFTAGGDVQLSHATAALATVCF